MDTKRHEWGGLFKRRATLPVFLPGGQPQLPVPFAMLPFVPIRGSNHCGL